MMKAVNLVLGLFALALAPVGTVADTNGDIGR